LATLAVSYMILHNTTGMSRLNEFCCLLCERKEGQAVLPEQRQYSS